MIDFEPPLFIAEVKTRSPFGFRSKHGWRSLLDLAIEHGDIVAVHTDPRWGGGLGMLEMAAKILSKVGYPQLPHSDRKKPLLLAKGIHETDEEIRNALDCGADLVLVVGRRPPRELAPVCIWEPTHIGAFAEFAATKQATLKIMWNDRDLISGKRRTGMESFNNIRNCYPGWLCQASFIRRPMDVYPCTDAFIVGEHLPEFVYDIRSLRGV